MALAELHGKISSSGSNLHERLEDLLTANVFGPLRYMPDSTAVLRLLSMAKSVIGTGTLADITGINQLLSDDGEVQLPSVRFWPNLHDCEPDILYQWELPDGNRLIIMVEVKYHSGKSGSGFADSGASEEDVQPAVSDQLYWEYSDLLSIKGPKDTYALVYLTAHASQPNDSIRESLTTITEPQPHIYWLSWSSIYWAARRLSDATMDAHIQMVWQDIEDLLLRKGLTGLRDWSEVISSDYLPLSGWYQADEVDNAYRWPTQAMDHDTLAWIYSAKAGYQWPAQPFMYALVPYRHRRRTS